LPGTKAVLMALGCTAQKAEAALGSYLCQRSESRVAAERPQTASLADEFPTCRQNTHKGGVLRVFASSIIHTLRGKLSFAGCLKAPGSIVAKVAVLAYLKMRSSLSHARMCRSSPIRSGNCSACILPGVQERAQ
jgi:hypothetical protein